MNEINSPLLIDSNKVKEVFVFKTSQIVENYKNINIDVSRFFDQPEVKLYKCLATGYRFYYPYSTIGDAEFYKDLSINRENYYSTRWEHNITLKQLNPYDTVLEIGSGFGVFLSLLKLKGIDGKGLELNPHAVQKCTVEGLKVEGKLIQEVAKENTEKFSIVCNFQVLEHITDVHSFLKASIEVLKPNGKLIIGVPNNNPYLFINDTHHTLNLPPHHAGLWNKESLKSLETIFPLQLISMEFEPLTYTFTYFLNVQMKKSNFIIKLILRVLNKIFPRLLKKVLCKFINGRNVLAVYKKVI